MRVVGIPSSASRFHVAVLEILERALGRSKTGDPRALTYSLGGVTVIEARGRDLPRLVSLGVVDLALSGFDTFLEARLAGYRIDALRTRSSRPTQLALIAQSTREPGGFRRVFSEYPLVTEAWLSRHASSAPPVVPLRGSVEGLVVADSDCAGVTTVTTGKTLAANGLNVCAKILESDLCLMTPSGHIESARSLLPLPLEAPQLPGWAVAEA